MNAEWAAVLVAAIVAAGAAARALLTAGRREGKLDAILERLTAIGEDHEDRLRALESAGVFDGMQPARRRDRLHRGDS